MYMHEDGTLLFSSLFPSLRIIFGHMSMRHFHLARTQCYRGLEWVAWSVQKEKMVHSGLADPQEAEALAKPYKSKNWPCRRDQPQIGQKHLTWGGNNQMV